MFVRANTALGVGLAAGTVVSFEEWGGGEPLPIVGLVIAGAVAGLLYAFPILERWCEAFWAIFAFAFTMVELDRGKVCGIAKIGQLEGRELVAIITVVAVMFWLGAAWHHGPDAAFSATLLSFLLAEFLSFVAFPNGIEVDASIGLTTIVLIGLGLILGASFISKHLLNFVKSWLSGALAVTKLLIYLAVVAIPVCGVGPARVLVVAVAFLAGWSPPSIRPSISGLRGTWRWMGPRR